MDVMLKEHKDFLLLLIKYKVEFILIGGYAVIFYGYERTTADMDIWLRPDNENRDKFIDVLRKQKVSNETIALLQKTDFTKHHVMHLGQKPNQIDFLTKVSGIEFDEAWQQKVMLPLKKAFVPVIQYQHLIISKIATDRLKDKADVEELQKINRLRK